MSNILVNSFDGSTYTPLKPQSYYADNANYSSSSGNADTLDGYHANSFLTDSSTIPLGFLTDYIGKFANISFSFPNTAITTQVYLTNFAVAQYISTKANVRRGMDDIICTYKRITQYKYSELSSFSSYSVPANCVIITNPSDGNQPGRTAFNKVSDGEEFQTEGDFVYGTSTILASYYTRSALTITKGKKSGNYNYLITRQTYYSGDIQINQGDPFYQVSKNAFSYKSSAYCSENIYFYTSKNLFSLLEI